MAHVLTLARSLGTTRNISSATTASAVCGNTRSKVQSSTANCHAAEVSFIQLRHWSGNEQREDWNAARHAVSWSYWESSHLYGLHPWSQLAKIQDPYRWHASTCELQLNYVISVLLFLGMNQLVETKHLPQSQVEW